MLFPDGELVAGVPRDEDLFVLGGELGTGDFGVGLEAVFLGLVAPSCLAHYIYYLLGSGY